MYVHDVIFSEVKNDTTAGPQQQALFFWSSEWWLTDLIENDKLPGNKSLIASFSEQAL